jgi:hypothetical protein
VYHIRSKQIVVLVVLFQLHRAKGYIFLPVFPDTDRRGRSASKRFQPHVALVGSNITPLPREALEENKNVKSPLVLSQPHFSFPLQFREL